MSDRIEAEILDVLGEEVVAAVDTPLVVIEGTKGDPGADGITPTIGDNGNWYLGSTDTGKPSRGGTGPQGAPGIYYGTTQPTGDTHPVWIDPDGGPDDGGLLPAVTAADNGKVLRVANGAWAPVDMPTGGGGEKWELIKAITIADDAAESNALTINMDESGNPFSLKKAKIFGIFPVYKGSSTRPNFSFFMLNGVSVGANTPYCYTSGWETASSTSKTYCSVEVSLTKPGMQEETVWRSNSASKEYFGPAKIESVTSIGGTNMLIYPGCQFWLYGVRKEGTA